MISHLKNNVVGYLALLVALSGTSYAAVTLSDGQVKTRHLATGAVTSAKVADNSLRARDLNVAVLQRTRLVSATSLAIDDQAISLPAAEDTAGVAAARGFVLLQGGSVYLRFSQAGMSQECNGGSSAYAGLYVDGQAVPGSGVFGFEQDRFVELVGRVSLDQGEHLVEVRTSCPGSTPVSGPGLVSPRTWTILSFG